jgi:DNA-directed RNA polymerase subunit M/transcription elongation factor TFIIS
MQEEKRNCIKTSLKLFLKSDKNINILERAMYQSSHSEIEYNDIAYEVFILLKEGIKLIDIMDKIKAKKMAWGNEQFNEVALKKKEQDDFTISPFQVEEGVLQCPKCKGCKSFSYSKQTRSADEPMTTFATCFHCKHKWTYSG